MHVPACAATTARSRERNAIGSLVYATWRCPVSTRSTPASSRIGSASAAPRATSARSPCPPRGRAEALPILEEAGVDLVLTRSEEHTSELQSRRDIVCRLLLRK